jgi:hypothetical protein
MRFPPIGFGIVVSQHIVVPSRRDRRAQTNPDLQSISCPLVHAWPLEYAPRQQFLLTLH